jgi:hypothetical protein
MTPTTNRRGPRWPGMCLRGLCAAFLSFAALTLSGCLPPALEWAANQIGTGDDGQGGTGPATLLVNFDSQLGYTLVPAIDMTPASYAITGRGPSGANFLRTTTGSGPVAIQDLEAGAWSVTVEASNAAATVIGNGTAQATLKAGSQSSADVHVKPLSGYGTLQLNVSWPAAQVATASVTAQLVPAAGATRTLTFTLGSGTATCSTTNIPTGYHTLSLQVLDGGVLVAGAIEIVRIVKDQTTGGTFAFTQVNPAPANMQVSITPEMDTPLTLTLSGQKASVVEGTGFTVQGSVPGVTGNVVYTWYLNGGFRTTGASFAVPANLTAGSYRIDVTAFTADGLRAGSANSSFTVTAAPASTQVTLMWDAPADLTNVAGYKVHYGTSTGVYPNVIDAGNSTSVIVTGLQPGVTYYFVAASYNSGGTESTYSNEVSFTP